MNKYSLYNFSQETVNEIKQNGSKWSLDKPYYDEFLVELPKLVQKFDLSKIITKVDYPGEHVSIFNAVGDLAPYAQLAKWVENAINDEQQGENANHQWKTIKAVLEEAQNKGIDYCSLTRGWENNKGAAQGDQILKLLEKNLQATKNHKIKSEIFNLILEEANKEEYGLYAIPSNYKNNENVKHAAAKHQEFVNDELVILAVCWATIEPTEDLFENESSDEESNISYNDFTPPPGMPKELDLNNPNSDHWNTLFNQATALADKATSTPENFQTWLNNSGSILNNAVSGEQPSTSSNTANSNRVELNVKESINGINKLIQNYKIVISNEYKNRVLETRDAETIDQALNKPDAIKQALLMLAENLTKSLGSHYASLDEFNQSLFVESDEFQNLAQLIEDISPIAYNESKALRYEYCKVIVKGTSNPLQVLGSMFGGEPLNPLKATAETYIKWYEENFSRSENFETIENNLNNHIVDSLGDTLQVDLDLD